MKNEILEGLWEIKDQIAHKYGYDVEKLAADLRKKEKKEKNLLIDFTSKNRSAIKI